jgi:hypothetical protein
MGFDRIYLDEDSCEARLAEALRRYGFDVLSTVEAGRVRETDDSQLAFATLERRLILTANAADFAGLQADWGASGRSHFGIIVRRQVGSPPEALALTIFEFAGSLPKDGMSNAIYYV